MKWVGRIQGEVTEPPRPMPSAIWKVLQARGFETESELEVVLNPKLKDLTHPLSIDDMDKAVERLKSAYDKHEQVAIYGDYDLDGTPGVALLVQALTDLGFKTPLYCQPKRLKDGYGIHPHLIEELHSKGAQILLTVDVGITDIVAIDRANELGMDVIVTDHHLPKEELPRAFAIVNPNKGDCGSGMTHLSGTGVAFYLILALKSKLNADYNPKQLLDLFALATITDMVPLVKENRVLVKHGLVELAKTKRPGLRRLMGELNVLGKKLGSTDVSFKIAPKLNALSRLELGVLPIEVLLADKETAPRVVEEALLINQQRLELQKLAEAEVYKSFESDKPEHHVFVTSDKFHPGVVSVVANQVMDHFNLPVFLGAELPNGKVVGSSRAPEALGLSLPEVLNSVSSSLEKFGGHALAAGFESSKEKLESLKANLAEYFASGGKDIGSEHQKHFDADLSLQEFNESFMNWHESLEPFGVGFESPIYCFRSMKIKEVKKLKKGHVKLSFTDSFSRKIIQGPWFSPDFIPNEGDLLHIYFEPQWNDFRGIRRLEVMIKGAEPA